MFFPNTNFSFQSNSFQAEYHKLSYLFSILQNQILKINTQNASIQQKILQITKKTFQLKHFQTQNKIEFQEKDRQTYPKKIIKKTNRHFQVQDRNLLEIKQNKNISKLNKTYKKISPNHQKFKCTYEKCQKEYKSSFSLNLHIKIHHNGGSKRQRQKYASIIYQAIQKGQQIPQIPIILPPHFLQDFRSNFNYMKKYKM